MTYFSNQHGRAEYNSWMHMASSDYAAIAQGTDAEILKDRYYAQMVYQINATPVSGSVTVDSVGINGDGEVAVSGDNLKVLDETSLAELRQIHTKLDNLRTEKFSTIMRVHDNFTYVMHAVPENGITSGDSVWRISRTYDDSALNLNVLWADGDRNFDKAASAYLSYNYLLG